LTAIKDKAPAAIAASVAAQVLVARETVRGRATIDEPKARARHG
jgi:xanthine/CO dehydrogenase XdhC/CoxF family maturation factor